MLNVKIAGLEFNPPITNASGPECDTFELLEKIAKSGAGGIMTKSMTMVPRQGNPEPRLAKDVGGNSLNSMGLPNLGYKAYASMIPKLKKYRKPIIASVASCDNVAMPITEQFAVMAAEMERAGADMIEINASCPNVSKVPIGIDPKAVDEILAKVKQVVKVPVGIKLNPYGHNLNLFEEIAGVILKNRLAFVSTINSIPNCMEIDLKTKSKLIRPNHGYGGFGGPAILAAALAEVNRFYNYFREHGSHKIAIFGVGGVSSPESAIKHFLAGADAVQIGTYYMQKGPGVFAELARGVENWLRIEGYSNISEIIGAVKEI